MYAAYHPARTRKGDYLWRLDGLSRAFEAGWGGVVWKTLGEEGPPIVNVNGKRYESLLSDQRRVIGFNNIELITDRPL